MDVDTDNFEEALASLEKHLPQASFVSIDLEMTGISGGPATHKSQGDTPFDTYAKCRDVVNQPYNIVQVGICLFEESRDKAGAFECRPFNIYVFPRPVDARDSNGKPLKTDPYVGLSTSSTMFLANHGFDFNRWIKKGVSYTSPSVQEALIQLMPSDGDAATEPTAQMDKDKERLEPTRPQDIKLIDETMEKVKAFASLGQEEMKLPGVNNFLALILRQRIADAHPGLVVDKRPNPENPQWQDRWVMNLSADGWRRRHEETRRKIQAQIGFSRMWHALKSSKKDLVLHNGFFDLLFLASAFESDLPATLPEFKTLIHKNFPAVFDTKTFAESEGLSGLLDSRSALPGLAKGLSERLKRQGAAPDTENPEVSFSLPEGFDQYASAETLDGAFHTAGYDAYETGRIFAYYRSVLGAERLREFNNRIFLMPSVFELVLHDASDKLKIEGVSRYVHDIDTQMITSRTINDLMRPVMENGDRRLMFRWCSGGRSLLLFVYGGADTADDSPGRAACEKAVDAVLQAQVDQGRLEFCTIAEHLAAQTAASDASGAKRAADDACSEPPAKRQRQMSTPGGSATASTVAPDDTPSSSSKSGVMEVPVAQPPPPAVAFGSPIRPQESCEIRQLREELQAKERALESLRRGAVDHMSLIEALERETFLKEETVRRLRESEAAHKEVAALTAELKIKDEDINRLRLQATSNEDALKVLAGEAKGKGDLVEGLVCAISEVQQDGNGCCGDHHGSTDGPSLDGL